MSTGLKNDCASHPARAEETGDDNINPYKRVRKLAACFKNLKTAEVFPQGQGHFENKFELLSLKTVQK